jgi:hypothetical protein
MLLIQRLVVLGHVADAGLDRILPDREHLADAEVGAVVLIALVRALPGRSPV